MKPTFQWLKVLTRLMVVIGVLFSGLITNPGRVQAQVARVNFADIQTIYTSKVGVSSPVGFAFLPDAKGFLVWDYQAELSQARLLSNYKYDGGSVNLPGLVEGTEIASYDQASNSLFFLNRTSNQLSKINLNRSGFPETGGRAAVKVNARPFGVVKPAGITFDPSSGRLYLLDARGGRVVSVMPGTGVNFDGDLAVQEGRIQRFSIRGIGTNSLQGIAFNPSNRHLYVAAPAAQTIYETTLTGEVVGSFDLSNFNLSNIQSLVFAPSADQTDDPSVQYLFVLDGGSTSADGSVQKSGSILELTLNPMALPVGIPMLPASLVRTIDTSSAAWNPSSPDPSGIDFFPLTGRLMIDDSEVDEMSVYAGANVYFSTVSGSLVNTCNTLSFSREPTGLAINPVNNRIYMTDDDRKEIYEINIGPDNVYCTPDDSVTKVSTVTLFGGSGSDPEDMAIGNNTLFMAGGSDAEVYYFSLGANGVLGGGDDGPVSHFDTLAMGFKDLEGIGYNYDSGTLFIVSTSSTDRYLGEVTVDGTLLRGYDLGFMGSAQNIRSDVAFIPSLANPAVKNIYIASRGIDNDSGTGSNPLENDGKVWEVSIGSPIIPTPTNTPTPMPPTSTPIPTATNTPGPSPTPTDTPPPTVTPTPLPTATDTPTPTPTPAPSSNPLYLSMASNGTIGGISFADEDILAFDGINWSILFDGSDVGVGNQDLFAFSMVDADTILMAFTGSGTVNGVSFTPRDVLMFEASSLGSVTSGTFSMYLNGIDVGLDANGENIDSVDTLADGRILISTTGSTGGLSVAAVDEDILAFTPTTLGANTSGSWAMYFDGSDVGLSTNSNEDIDALDVDSLGNIYLSTLGDFAVTGVSGFDEDVFICSPTSLGSVTACNFSSTLFFDGSTWLQDANDVDAFNLNSTTPAPTPTSTPTSTNTPTLAPTSTPTDTPTLGPTATDTPTPLPTDTSTPGPTATNTPVPPPTSTPTNTPPPTSTPTNTPPPTDTPTPTPTPEPIAASIYISLDGSGTVGGVAAEDVDILFYDGIGWSIFFDASDVGISTSGQDMNDFAIVDASTILMTFRSAFILNGINVDPWDILQFSATSLGSDTAGTFSLYFDGNDVGLDTSSEVIDALDRLPDGRILISTTANASVPGLTAQDEDVLAFTPATLGETTTGNWELYFDGTAVGLGDTTGEDVDSLAVYSNGDIFLSTLDLFTVTGVSGANEDVFICTPSSLGTTTVCTFVPVLYFDGSTWALDTNDVDGVHIP